MATPETKLPLKFMIDRKRNKVIFAEAGSDLVDVILSFLTLPLGTIIRRLNQHFGGDTNLLGCFNNLYSSIQKFSDSDFVSKEDRHVLLHPLNASQSASLKLKVDDSEPRQYYTCPTYNNCPISWNKIFFDPKVCFYCFCHMKSVEAYPGFGGKVFTDCTKSFIITDDLRLMPALDGLNFELIKNLASDVVEFEEKTLNVGLNEIMRLLKLSLLTSAPLTKLLFLHVESDKFYQSNFGTLTPKHETEDSRKMVIKALVQNSTNKLLFFLAGDDFVGFLFRLLTIPLGSAGSLLCGNTGLGSIDNLYASIHKLNSEYLVWPKESLLNPKVVFHDNNVGKFLSFNEKSGTSDLRLMDLIFTKRLMKGTSTFMVTDDLIVTPLTPTSIISHLQSCKIPVSDVNEVAYNIGTKEALDILKATLTSSTSALSNALQLMKQPKEEK